MTTKVYNADEVSIVFGPVIADSGFADGEFLRVEQESDDTEDVAGTDGEVTVSRSNDRRATVTLLLMQTSRVNDALSVISTAVKESPGMAGGVWPFLVKDLNGTTLISGANCWIQKAPDRSWDRTAQTVEWTLRIGRLIRFDGGNNSL